jgi:hypothetical protein
LTILASDHFGAARGRDGRVLAFAAEAAATELSDRTVFCAVHMSWADVLGIASSLFDPGQAEGIRAGDIVVLDRSPSQALYHALRDRGAHSVRRVDPGAAGRESDLARGEARAQADAYVTAWREPGPRGLTVEHLIAVMPAAGRVCDKSMFVGPSEPVREDRLAVAWRSLLADVVHDDHDEHVGGVRRPCPTVAAR